MLNLQGLGRVAPLLLFALKIVLVDYGHVNRRTILVLTNAKLLVLSSGTMLQLLAASVSFLHYLMITMVPPLSFCLWDDGAPWLLLVVNDRCRSIVSMSIQYQDTYKFHEACFDKLTRKVEMSNIPNSTA
jgi:hypothetical protein